MSLTAASGAPRPVGRFQYGWSSGTWDWDVVMFDLHGVNPGRQAPRTEALLELIHADDQPRLLALLDSIVVPDRYSVFYRTRATPERHLLLVAHAKAGRGEGLAAEGFVVDVTDLLQQSREEAVQAALSAALDGRDTIEQAKGMLMLLYALSADQAFALLGWWSSNRNVRVRVLAERLVDAATRGGFAQPGLRVAFDRLLYDLTSPLESTSPEQVLEVREGGPALSSSDWEGAACSPPG